MSESNRNDKKTVKFKILGEPKGKQRPRVVHRGEAVRTYTPQQTVIYENLVKISYQQQVGEVVLDPPVKATIVGVFGVPKSTSKKKTQQMLAGEILHTKKIDCDNLAKIVLDSLNKVAFRDDAEVAELVVRKIYGENPMVEVTLEEIGGAKDERAEFSNQESG